MPHNSGPSQIQCELAPLRQSRPNLQSRGCSGPPQFNKKSLLNLASRLSWVISTTGLRRGTFPYKDWHSPALHSGKGCVGRCVTRNRKGGNSVGVFPPFSLSDSGLTGGTDMPHKRHNKNSVPRRRITKNRIGECASPLGGKVVGERRESFPPSCYQ